MSNTTQLFTEYGVGPETIHPIDTPVELNQLYPKPYGIVSRRAWNVSVQVPTVPLGLNTVLCNNDKRQHAAASVGQVATLLSRGIISQLPPPIPRYSLCYPPDLAQ